MKILIVLNLANQEFPGGRMTGDVLMRICNAHSPKAEVFSSEEHCQRLCRDLVGKGYIIEKDTRSSARQVFGLRHLSYSITEKGIDYVHGSDKAPKDPMIADDRI